MKKLLAVFLVAGMWLSLAGTAFADTPYVVQRGDTLFRIAVRFHTTVSALAQANHIANPNRIFVGQVLRIPSAPAAHLTRYVVKRGDTLWRLAGTYRTSVAAIQAANRLNTTLIFTGQVLWIPTR